MKAFASIYLYAGVALSLVEIAPQGLLAEGTGLPPMLRLTRTGEDAGAIDYGTLPVLKGEHGLVTAGEASWRFRLHNYLAYYDGRYWCMWSHGPKIEDHPTQHVRFATSLDGLRWTEGGQIVGPSEQAGFRYISRGLWLREGKLIALVSHDEAYNEAGKVHFFGKSLELLAFQWESEAKVWRKLGVVYRDAINNFPPQKLATGEWAMMRRDHDNNVSMLIGGVASPLKWEARTVFTRSGAGEKFRPDEPEWWLLPDGRPLGMIRDNGGSKRLFRSLSTDHGRTWTAPELTNFPDATSKFFGLRTSRGYYVLVSNSNPQKRNPLCLSVSEDGVTFTQMYRLPVPVVAEGGEFDSEHTARSLQYPHVMEHEGALLVAYSRGKATIEVVKVRLDEVDRLRAAQR